MKKIEESTIKNNALERSEDDFGCMLYLLEQLNMNHHQIQLLAHAVFHYLFSQQLGLLLHSPLYQSNYMEFCVHQEMFLIFYNLFHVAYG